MNDQRIWRRDQGAVLGGVCAGLAEDLDLPLPLVRAVGVIFLIFPTGLAYLALSMLLRRLPVRRGTRPGVAARMALRPELGETRPAPSQNIALLAHRFEAMEPRLKRIEAFVTSGAFELDRDFRRMDEQGLRGRDK
jgi:phage shock protein C